MIKRLLTFFYIALTVTATAQTDSASKKQWDEVVITGQHRPQSVKQSVYQVRTISKERILKQGATKLQDVLLSELNVRFTQDLATGGSNITLMGLRGQNVKVLIDGLPMTGRQGTNNEIDINQIDINSIERIEIIEGPMSVIYGADALAGVINIITKKAAPSPLSVTARLHEETAGKEYGIQQGTHNQYVALSWHKNHLEIGGALGHNYFGGWKDTAVDRELVWHKKDQLIANGYIGWQNNRFSIRYRIDGLDEIITNPGNFTSYYQPANDTLANDQEYLSQRTMHQLQATYAASKKLSLQAQSSYTAFSRQVFSTTVSKKTGDVRLNTSNGAQSVVNFNSFTFRGSAVYKWNNWLSLQPGVDINLESGEGERLKAGQNRVDDYAVFITADIIPSSRISLRPGVRFINNSVYDAPPAIPSLNLKWALTRHIDLRLAYANGFRSPSLRELYFNFFDANHQIIGNPDLKAETSNSFTGAISWMGELDKTPVTATVGGFYNKLENMIDYAVSAANPNIFILTNVSNSKTAGVNFTGTARKGNWNASLGAAYTGFYNVYAESDKSLPELKWSGELNSTLGYNFPKAGLGLNLFYKFTGKRPYYIASGQTFTLTEQEGYHWADLTLQKKAGKLLLINAGIRNLFNVTRINSTVAGTGTHTAGGTTNLAYGRSFFAGIVFNWNRK